MTKTTNYQLPQWEAEDPLRREDFNEAMAKVDTLHVVGTYKGNGVAMADGGQQIELGFKPRFVIISRGWTSTTATGSCFLAVGTVQIADLANTITFTTNGFQVGTGNGGTTLNLNYNGTSFAYIAFR